MVDIARVWAIAPWELSQGMAEVFAHDLTGDRTLP